MTYLMSQIVLFLVAAFMLGAAIAWWLRHAVARTEKEKITRTMLDAQALIPRFETEVRSRDQTIRRLTEDVATWRNKFPALAKKLDQREGMLRERDRTIHQLKNKIRGLEAETINEDQPKDTTELEAAMQPLLGTPLDDTRIAMLEEQLSEQHDRYQSLTTIMDDQTQQIEDLYQERQRQDKAVEVLNQQLELARESNENLASNLRSTRDALRNLEDGHAVPPPTSIQEAPKPEPDVTPEEFEYERFDDDEDVATGP